MVLASGNGREEERRRGERRGEKVNKLWQTHVMKAERDWQALHIRWGAQGYCKHSHVNLPGVGRERDTAHTLFSGADYFKNEWQRCTRKRERFPDNQHARSQHHTGNNVFETCARQCLQSATPLRVARSNITWRINFHVEIGRLREYE